jgi:hypothetical protein
MVASASGLKNHSSTLSDAEAKEKPGAVDELASGFIPQDDPCSIAA